MIPGIELPIGISFFTFQALSYVLDVQRGRGQAQRSPLKVGLYISFFPQLIAGPIVKYETVADQIDHRKETWDDFAAGCARFIVGLGKKVLLANQLALVADRAFLLEGADRLTTAFAWLGSLCYTLQIYYDFSGYSDMAIGLGKMFGFHFLENFNYPYISRSVTEFWRRWHISLSTWFRDYVYFPLGGSRVSSKAKHIRNLFVVWLLTGIWHGANWTFIAWGLFYFVLLVLEKYGHLGRGWPAVCRWLFTFLMVNFAWVIFRADGPGGGGGLSERHVRPGGRAVERRDRPVFPGELDGAAGGGGVCRAGGPRPGPAGRPAAERGAGPGLRPAGGGHLPGVGQLHHQGDLQPLYLLQFLTGGTYETTQYHYRPPVSPADGGRADAGGSPPLWAGRASWRACSSPPSGTGTPAPSSSEAESAVNSDLDRDHLFIQLYGGVQRLSGRRVIQDMVAGNTVAKLSTGALNFVNLGTAGQVDQEAVGRRAQATAELAAKLEVRGIPYLYIAAPQKIQRGARAAAPRAGGERQRHLRRLSGGAGPAGGGLSGPAAGV